MPGIMLYESGENSIVHNVIKGYARDAIGLFGSQPAMGVVQDNVLVNFESSNRFTQTKSNYVAWNDMSLTNLDSDDTGEIEMYGTGSDNIMEYNALHDIYDSSTGMVRTSLPVARHSGTPSREVTSRLVTTAVNPGSSRATTALRPHECPRSVRLA